MRSRETSAVTRGLEHPGERFEFARFCLLNHYARNDGFTAELDELATVHRETLDAVGAKSVSKNPGALADYRVAWGVLSFLSREPQTVGSAHPLRSAVRAYRSDLSAFASHWRLAADWCAPSLHLALLAPVVFPANFEDPSRVAGLTPLFSWDLQREGPAPHDTVLSLPRLLLHQDAPGRRTDTVLLQHGGETVYYDPRIDRWADCLKRARYVLGRKRLSPDMKRGILERSKSVEAAFGEDGYVVRSKPRRLGGEHTLARWVRWTYLAICPPGRTTAQILEMIDRGHINTQYVDRAIKRAIDLLELPGRFANLR